MLLSDWTHVSPHLTSLVLSLDSKIDLNDAAGVEWCSRLPASLTHCEMDYTPISAAYAERLLTSLFSACPHLQYLKLQIDPCFATFFDVFSLLPSNLSSLELRFAPEILFSSWLSPFGPSRLTTGKRQSLVEKMLAARSTGRWTSKRWAVYITFGFAVATIFELSKQESITVGADATAGHELAGSNRMFDSLFAKKGLQRRLKEEEKKLEEPVKTEDKAEDVEGAPKAEAKDVEGEAKDGKAEVTEEKEGGEGKDKKEAEEEINPVHFAIAVLLFGFLAFNMVILYCVNYPDANIRHNVYNMINTTISIFCAVLLNQAISSFLLEQILPSPPPRGLGVKEVTHTHKVIVGTILFMVAFCLLNGMGWKFGHWLLEQKTQIGAEKTPKDAKPVDDEMPSELKLKETQNQLFAFRVIGGHVMAFAGILTLSNFQSRKHGKDGAGPETSLLTSTIVAIVVLCLVRWASSRARMHLGSSLSKKGEPPVQKEGTSGHSETKGLLEQDASKSSAHAGPEKNAEAEEVADEVAGEIAEGEDDGTALIISYLGQQIVYFVITGKLPALGEGEEKGEKEGVSGGSPAAANESHHERLLSLVPAEDPNHNKKVVLYLLVIAAGFILILGICTYFTSSWDKKEEKEEKDKEKGHKAAEKKGEEPAQGVLNDVFYERLSNVSRMVLAMSMSWCFLRIGEKGMEIFISSPNMAVVASALVMTGFSLVMIRLLDLIADKFGADAKNEKPLEPATAPASSPAPASGSRDLHAHAQQPPDLQQVAANLAENLAVKADSGAVEMAVRKIIDAFGLLVGLCWDKAFDAAGEVLVEGTAATKKHPVVAKVALAFILVGFVVPAWVWYIVPKAREGADYHERAMTEEKGAAKKCNECAALKDQRKSANK